MVCKQKKTRFKLNIMYYNYEISELNQVDILDDKEYIKLF